MSAPEAPAETEAQQILQGIEGLGTRVEAQTDALNHVGELLQWIVDNVSGLFQMMHNPMMGSMIGQVLSGGGMPSPEDLQIFEVPDTTGSESTDG